MPLPPVSAASFVPVPVSTWTSGGMKEENCLLNIVRVLSGVVFSCVTNAGRDRVGYV